MRRILKKIPAALLRPRPVLNRLHRAAIDAGHALRAVLAHPNWLALFQNNRFYRTVALADLAAVAVVCCIKRFRSPGKRVEHRPNQSRFQPGSRSGVDVEHRRFRSYALGNRIESLARRGNFRLLKFRRIHVEPKNIIVWHGERPGALVRKIPFQALQRATRIVPAGANGIGVCAALNVNQTAESLDEKRRAPRIDRKHNSNAGARANVDSGWAVLLQVWNADRLIARLSRDLLRNPLGITCAGEVINHIVYPFPTLPYENEYSIWNAISSAFHILNFCDVTIHLLRWPLCRSGRSDAKPPGEPGGFAVEEGGNQPYRRRFTVEENPSSEKIRFRRRLPCRRKSVVREDPILKKTPL